MAALALNADRVLTQGETAHYPMAANDTPFQGSFMGINSSGYYARLTGGMPFAGVCEIGVISRDSPTTNGGRMLRVKRGSFRMTLVISGLTVADILARREVYASTDNDVSLTSALGNTRIGRLLGLASAFGGPANGIVVQCDTHEVQQSSLKAGVGCATLADAAALLTVSQLDTLLEIPNTAARTLTLPAVASCTGRCFRILKTNSAAFAVTLQGNASENINGANTYATATANYSYAQIESDGTQWLLTGKI